MDNLTSTPSTKYTSDYLDLMESSERTGLLYELAISSFNEGQLILTDGEDDTIIIPMITKSSWVQPDNLELNISNSQFEDIDDEWMEQVFTRLDYQNAGEIWNGDVCQVENITTDGTIEMNHSTYFTLASHREKYISEITDLIYDSIDNLQIPSRDISDLSTQIYSLIGITYTTIIDPPSTETRYLLYGVRSHTMNELSSFRTLCPAGIVQPRHTETESWDEMVKEHFKEEFSEEVLHNTISEDEIETQIQKGNIEYNTLGLGVEPLRYSTEIAGSAYITGDFAEYVLENMEPNEEMETLEIYEVDSVQTCYNPLFSRGLTPQSLFSLGLFLSENIGSWELIVF